MNFKVLPKSVSVDPSETYQLSPEEVKFYEDNGYLVVKKLFGQPALDSYRKRFVAVCKGELQRGLVNVLKDYTLSKTSSNPEDYIYRIQDLLYDEVFSTYSENPRLLHVVSQLIGDELTATNSMLINKPPGTNTHPPHQDLFYLPVRPAHLILGAWTAVDPASKENGCLFVIPGSHKPQKVLDHSYDTNDETKLFFCAKNWETPDRKRVYLEMDPGDTVLISSATVHGSLPNVSKMYRKAMSCHFANSRCQYIDVASDDYKLLTSLVDKIVKPRGCDLNYIEIWRMKMKAVKGLRCNL